MQHADAERFVNSQDLGGDATKDDVVPRTTPRRFTEGFEHASNPAIEIPEARGASPRSP